MHFKSQTSVWAFFYAQIHFFFKVRYMDRFEILEKLTQTNFKTSTELLTAAVESMIKFMDSQIGYIYYYQEETEEFILHAWSRSVAPLCTVINPQKRYKLADTGIWGDVVRKRQPIIVNNYKDLDRNWLPEGHVQLTSFCAVPIFSDGKIVATAGVANNVKGYSESDILKLREYTILVWHINELKVKEEETQKTLFLFDQAQKLTNSGNWELDLDTMRFTTSENARKIYGMSLDAVLDMETVQERRLPEYIKFTDALQMLIDKNIPYNYEFKIRRFDNKIVDVHSVAVFDKVKNVIFGVIQDITDRKSAEEALEKELRNKELLFKEVHHRIKNNLQMTVSLLSLPMNEITDEKTLKIFEDTIHRVQVMAITHQNLYKQSLESSEVKLREYIEDIINSLILDEHLIDIKLDIDDTELDMKKATSFGLLVNELVTNSIKHAFVNNYGNINIRVYKNNDIIYLEYTDNGIGIKKDDKRGLGSILIEALSQQLEGEGEYLEGSGVHYVLKFKLGIV